MWLRERSVKTTEYSSKPSGSTWGGLFGFGGGSKPPPIDVAQEAKPEQTPEQKREQMYQRAKKLIGQKSYDPIKTNCETFAFEVTYGTPQPEPRQCPMCTTTGHRVSIFSKS